MRVPSPEGRGEKGAVPAAWLSFFLAALLACLAADPAGAGTYAVAGFSDTAAVTGLNQPTDFTWTPDGRMLVLEKGGRVRIVVGGVLQGAPALDISASVDSGSEKGLLGICLDAGFATNGYVYLYYTNLVPLQNRVSRFTMAGNTLNPASETVILDHIDATNGNHNGGTVVIGPDGKLWAAPGDSGTGGAKSQDLSVGSLNGKVLRMELNGAPASGNPFLGDPTREPRIWAYGFRNPYRFTFRPSNGSLYVADVGQSSREEIDVVVAGGNYGWPMMEGTLGSPCTGCTLPVFEYDHTVGQAIIGGAFVTGSAYPPFLQGKYVFGDYVSSWIRYLDFDASGSVVGSLQNLATSAEGPVAFHIGPDGLLYYAAISTGRIYRINPPPPATSFFTVTPCRVADTRQSPGPYGGPGLSAGSSRTFVIAGQCGVPPSARFVSVNVTITQPTADGYLNAFAAGTFLPPTSLINFRAGQTRANNAALALGAQGDLTVFCGIPSPSGTVHFILDVNGYYQ